MIPMKKEPGAGTGLKFWRLESVKFSQYAVLR
jgi:hypothetical protein